MSRCVRNHRVMSADFHNVRWPNQCAKAKNIILATGSVPRNLPFIAIDGKHFVTSDEILELKEPPKSLIVLGSGAVGVEFAERGQPRP